MLAALKPQAAVGTKFTHPALSIHEMEDSEWTLVDMSVVDQWMTEL